MQTSFLIVIGILAMLLTFSLVIIAYLMKQVIDSKPIAIKETAAVGVKPEVLTRSDLKVARQYEQEQNFRNKDETKYADLGDLSPDQGMAEL